MTQNHLNVLNDTNALNGMKSDSFQQRPPQVPHIDLTAASR